MKKYMLLGLMVCIWSDITFGQAQENITGPKPGRVTLAAIDSVTFQQKIKHLPNDRNRENQNSTRA